MAGSDTEAIYVWKIRSGEKCLVARLLYDEKGIADGYENGAFKIHMVPQNQWTDAWMNVNRSEHSVQFDQK